MISATDLKKGITFKKDGKLYKVVKYDHQKIGRGGANVKLSLRNLETGSLEDYTFGSSNKFDEVRTEKRPLQYLYNDGNDASFMDTKTFEQVSVPLSVLGDDILYIKEGEIVDVLFAEGRALSVEIAPKVVLKVEVTAPGVKGNSATNIYKSAELENGLNVKVPLFIKVGDRVRIDTRTGQYVERVNN